jgi:hypothetical protein
MTTHDGAPISLNGVYHFAGNDGYGRGYISELMMPE